jgi:hypothetical protein
MTTITLQPITLTFTQTCEVSVEEYLEWCEAYENIPSQKGYKKFVIDYFEDDLRYDLDTNNFTFKYGKEKEYEYQETEFGEDETSFDYNDYVSDLSESEIEEFHKLVEDDKFRINPLYTRDDIIIMNSIENLSLDYGLKIDKETREILYIKKSGETYYLYEYLRTLD